MLRFIPQNSPFLIMNSVSLNNLLHLLPTANRKNINTTARCLPKCLPLFLPPTPFLSPSLPLSIPWSDWATWSYIATSGFLLFTDPTAPSAWWHVFLLSMCQISLWIFPDSLHRMSTLSCGLMIFFFILQWVLVIWSSFLILCFIFKSVSINFYTFYIPTTFPFPPLSFFLLLW